MNEIEIVRPYDQDQRGNGKGKEHNGLSLKSNTSVDTRLFPFASAILIFFGPELK